MKFTGKSDPQDPPIVIQFYHSQTFPYLIEKWQHEIRRQLKNVPETLRQRVLGPAMSLSLLKFVGQASLVDDAMLPS